MTTYTSEGKNLYLLRGIPGAGKSTLAKQLGCTHFETDTFFMVDGEYKFDPSKLRDAHKWCQAWEMEAYMELAKSWNYRVFSIIVENRHDGVNQHSVPEDKLQVMKDRFEFKL